MLEKINKEKINNFYYLKCESIASELYHSDGNISEFIQDTIENIENANDQEFLTNFEKIVYDYFIVNNLPLNCEILTSDIFKYL